MLISWECLLTEEISPKNPSLDICFLGTRTHGIHIEIIPFKLAVVRSLKF